MFSVDPERSSLRKLARRSFSDLDLLERQDLQEWIVEEPRLLGDEYLVITSEYAGFEETRDRLDILALDPTGKLVVVELKRDQADALTDLQAIKYASYCSTLTVEDLQQLYLSFWSKRGEDLTSEAVGERFIGFLADEAEVDLDVTEEGWAEFELDNRPRILLAAESFGVEVTSPVMWLIQEFGLDITCVRFEAYEHEGEVLLQGREIIPVPEAEEYMTRRREKEEKQRSSERRTRAIYVLLDRGILREGDIVVFTPGRHEKRFDETVDPEDEFFLGEVTGKTGRSDNVRWLHDGEEYSFTGLAKKIVRKKTGQEEVRLNGYKNWVHPDFDHRTLSDLRTSQIEAPQRKRV